MQLMGMEPELYSLVRDTGATAAFILAPTEWPTVNNRVRHMLSEGYPGSYDTR